jgi:hypothetical protein
VNPSISCKSRTSPTPIPQAHSRARLALLAWLQSCAPAELRAALAELPFELLQQLHELPDFCPPLPAEPSIVEAQEARVALLAARCARGVSLWHPDDAAHHKDELARVARVVSRRRNGSVAVHRLQRVDYTPPPVTDQWESLAAELAADQAALRAAQAAETKDAANESRSPDPGRAEATAPPRDVD